VGKDPCQTAGHIGFVQDPDGSRVQLAAVRVLSATITFRLDRGEGSFMTFVGKQSADNTALSGSVVVTADGTERDKTTWKAQRISSTTLTAPLKPSASSSDVGPRPPPAADKRGDESNQIIDGVKLLLYKLPAFASMNGERQ
jgi:hypothetical protein